MVNCFMPSAGIFYTAGGMRFMSPTGRFPVCPDGAMKSISPCGRTCSAGPISLVFAKEMGERKRSQENPRWVFLTTFPLMAPSRHGSRKVSIISESKSGAALSSYLFPNDFVCFCWCIPRPNGRQFDASSPQRYSKRGSQSPFGRLWGFAKGPISGAPAKRLFRGERRRNEMDEGSRLRGHEGYGVCVDEKGFPLPSFLLAARHRFLSKSERKWGRKRGNLANNKESGPPEARCESNPAERVPAGRRKKKKKSPPANRG